MSWRKVIKNEALSEWVEHQSSECDSEWNSIIREGAYYVEKAADMFHRARHSGFSVYPFADLLNRVILHKPLLPIEDKPELWSKIGVQELYQHKRCSSVFKEDGRIYTVDGYLFCNFGEDVYYSCSQSVKDIELPYYGEAIMVKLAEGETPEMWKKKLETIKGEVNG
jgi:hypothetical protein